MDELLAFLKTEGFHDIFDAIARDSANKKYPTDPILGMRLEQRLRQILGEETAENAPAPVRKMFPIRRFAAAAIILLICSSIYIYSRIGGEKAPSALPVPIAKTQKDIAPGVYKPVLTLSGGQKLVLDSSANTTIVMQGNTKVLQPSVNQLSYESTGPVAALQYNTLDNPRGSNVTTITLSDGTKVWLNAGSSITYPVAFNSTERNVEVSGEAYFEVTKNPNAPFTVKKKNADTHITVLGTHFNVNLYDDEKENKITLLEGAVNVSTPMSSRRLAPGEQALIQNSDIKLAKSVDIESVMAWKNGQFLLKGTDCAQLLRQVARWYDVDIHYQNNIPAKKFGGSISRNVNLSTVIEALKQNGINCTLNGKILNIE